jgi:hypothetical protein
MKLTGMTFQALANSSHGTINTDTTMTFVSDDESETLGNYHGGTIKTGNIVGRWIDPSTMEMLYHCITVTGELKAGRALASFSRDSSGIMHMHLDWQWLTGDQSQGTSQWVENVDSS